MCATTLVHRCTLVLGLLVSAGWSQGCVKACDLSLKSGLHVTVVGGGGTEDSSGGQGGTGGLQVECLATVSTDPVSSDFSCWTEGEDCVCDGFTELAKTVSVTVELDGKTETQSVTIEEDECHVITEKLCFFGDC